MTAEGLREKARELTNRYAIPSRACTHDKISYFYECDECHVDFAVEAMTLALEEAERAVRFTFIQTYSGEESIGRHKFQDAALAAIASLRSELGSGPEGE